MQEWVPIIQAVGIPTGILMMIAYAGWKTFPWIGNQIQVLATRHISFVDEVQKSLKNVAVAQMQQTEQLTKVVESLGALTDKNTKLTDEQIKLAEAQTKTEKKRNGS